jgi:hypothetical protein
MKKYVELGDRVTFRFTSGRYITGTIEYVPLSAGENWIITEREEGKDYGLVYIQTYEQMYVKERASTPHKQRFY